MEWSKLLFDFNKLPSRLVLIVLILSGIFLFVPDVYLAKIYVEKVKINYGLWIGVAFLFSLAYLILTFISFIQRKYGRYTWNKSIQKEIKENLQRLSPVEQAIIREFFITGNSAINLPQDEPSVVGLQHKHIISLAQSSLGGSYIVSGGFGMPNVLTGYARNVIEGDASLIEWPKPAGEDGKLTQKQMDDLLNDRPPWLHRNSFGGDSRF
jgi:hypothetical protein